MSNYTGFEPQDHSTLQIQGRVAGMFPGEWKAVWNASDSNLVVTAITRLIEYRQGRRHSPLFISMKELPEYRLVRITVRQTVTVDVLRESKTVAAQAAG